MNLTLSDLSVIQQSSANEALRVPPVTAAAGAAFPRSSDGKPRNKNGERNERQSPASADNSEKGSELDTTAFQSPPVLPPGQPLATPESAAATYRKVLSLKGDTEGNGGQRPLRA